jgi:hypothetical protein
MTSFHSLENGLSHTVGIGVTQTATLGVTHTVLEVVEESHWWLLR